MFSPALRLPSRSAGGQLRRHRADGSACRRSIHADDLREDLEFWRACSAVGYKDRINGHNQRWFEEEHHGEAEARVTELVAQKWSEAVASVRGLLPDA